MDGWLVYNILEFTASNFEATAELQIVMKNHGGRFDFEVKVS